PQPDRLPLLCTLLRIQIAPDKLKTVIGAYLETWIKSKDTAKWMLAPFHNVPEKKTASDPGTQALKRILNENTLHISLKQYEEILKSPSVFWCFQMLTNSKEPLTAQDFSKAVRMSKKEIEDALGILCKNGIAKRLKNGTYTSPMAGISVVVPARKLRDQVHSKDRIRDFHTAMVKKCGKPITGGYVTTRVNLDELNAGFIPYLWDTLRNVKAYSVSEKKSQSAVIKVEVKIDKLFDF
ncbi:hypothetical protein ACFL6Y_11200, partial [Elusimicrobiota bacterium]